MSETLMPTADVLQRIGVSRRTLEGMVKAGNFPHPVKVTARLNGWVRSEVDTWVQERIEKRDRGPRP